MRLIPRWSQRLRSPMRTSTRLVAERTQAKKTRNFARADAIRNDLLAKGILIEDSKDGVRWKRK